jgi:hypothetical protein
MTRLRLAAMLGAITLLSAILLTAQSTPTMSIWYVTVPSATNIWRVEAEYRLQAVGFIGLTVWDEKTGAEVAAQFTNLTLVDFAAKQEERRRTELKAYIKWLEQRGGIQ